MRKRAKRKKRGQKLHNTVDKCGELMSWIRNLLLFYANAHLKKPRLPGLRETA